MDLKELTELNAVSGHEQLIRRALLKELAGMPGVETHLDRAGNVIAEKKGRRGQHRILLTAHMDEVGFIVTSATEEGYLRFHPVGSVDPRVVISKRVLVGDDRIPGVIGTHPIHLLSAEDRSRVSGYDSLYVDIGAADQQEAEALAPIGTYIAFDTDYVEFGSGYASAKALDDRVGCMTQLRILREELDCDLICAFTAQEEVGCRGGRAAAWNARPDAAFVLEGTVCNDLGDIPEPNRVCEAGKGVAVSFMDAASIGDRALYRLAMRLSEEQSIPAQPKTAAIGGNDAGQIQRSFGAVPTLVLSVPCRYIHSPSSVICLKDMDAQFRLALALLKTYE